MTTPRQPWTAPSCWLNSKACWRCHRPTSHPARSPNPFNVASILTRSIKIKDYWRLECSRANICSNTFTAIKHKQEDRLGDRDGGGTENDVNKLICAVFRVAFEVSYILSRKCEELKGRWLKRSAKNNMRECVKNKMWTSKNISVSFQSTQKLSQFE